MLTHPATVSTLLLLLGACRSSGPAPAAADGAVAEAAVADAGAPGLPDAGLPPLGDAVWLEEISVGPKEAVFVTVPLGATEPRPMVVAAHGAGDRPEWSCSGWRGVTGGYAFVVCPRGTPVPDSRYSWGTPDQMESLIERGLRAVRARFGAYVAAGPPVFVAFSQGSRVGSHVVARRARGPDAIARVVFMEGGYDEAGSAEVVAALRALGAANKQAGGEPRVLLACSTGGCAGRWAASRAALARGGVTVRVHDTGPFGHNLNGEVVQSLSSVWSWVVEGDPRWASWRAP